MNILVLYQDIPSGSNVATESIIQSYQKQYPRDACIVYKQIPNRFSGRFSFTKNLAWSFFNFLWVLNNLQKQVDCVYTTMYTCVLATKFSKHHRTAIIFHIHGDQRFGHVKANSPLASRIYTLCLKRLVIFLQNHAVRAATHVCFVSKTAKREFLTRYRLSLYASKTSVIPNGVNCNIFKPASSKQQLWLKKRYRVPHAHVILYVGRIDEKKGIHFLIKALPNITLNDVCLTIVYPKYFDKHSEAYLHNLHVLANQQRTPVYFVHNPKTITDFYKMASCLVLPSTQEMLPLVVLEALASGLPVIANDVGSTKEVLQSVSATSLLRRLSSHELAASINNILHLPPKSLENLKVQGLAIAKKWTWKKASKALRAVFMRYSMVTIDP